jgi:hypothetical protein
MVLRTRIFVDYWNLVLAIRNRDRNRQVLWRHRLLVALFNAARTAINNVGFGTQCAFDEMRIYAGFVEQKDDALRAELSQMRDEVTGVRIFTAPRTKTRLRTRCNTCGNAFDKCPDTACGAKLWGTPEKGIDAWIATDMLSLAWEGAYDLAILVSTDPDYLPAIMQLQGKGIRVMNATWRNQSEDMASQCWGRVYLDPIINDLAPLPEPRDD